MSRKHYETFARIAGRTLAAAVLAGGEETRAAIYEEMYRPLVAAFNADNPAFDQLRFAAAVGTAEAAAIAEARG